MTMVRPVPATLTWAGVTYSYNGSLDPLKRMQIHDYYLESMETVETKLHNAQLGVEDVSKEWLHAQLLFRAFGRPGSGGPRTKREMRGELEAINKIMEDKYCIVSNYPITCCHISVC
jgi:hypothetical protein